MLHPTKQKAVTSGLYISFAVADFLLSVKDVMENEVCMHPEIYQLVCFLTSEK
jgi:hypothetical protein